VTKKQVLIQKAQEKPPGQRAHKGARAVSVWDRKLLWVSNCGTAGEMHILLEGRERRRVTGERSDMRRDDRGTESTQRCNSNSSDIQS
jgi:hypothetical protein